LHGSVTFLCHRERQFSFEEITSLLLIKPDLDGVSAYVGKGTSQAGNGRQGLVVALEAWMGRQVREQNGFIGSIVEHTDVAGKGPRTVTRKNQKHLKSKSHKRKDRRHDILTNSSQMVYAGLRIAFANPVTNGHESYAGCQHCRSHGKLSLLPNTNVLSP
jgi:hypothetical protein